ncbi:Ribonuclease H-like protein [Dioscorea alata]|uniref:Ribonuclease H-like protein n=1 Tax=Dioscorea alata TaxID=55571 RepID=A0ACB7V9F4_DIOAL|nr:Ribonuclease H-like protein [Dioscorea alata]
MEKKSELRTMFASSDWDKCKHSQSTKGRATYSTIMNVGFCNGVGLCLKVFAPLVWVLHLVDVDKKPSMGILYGELLHAKEEIKGALKNQETLYQEVLEIIETKAQDRLDRPLHLTEFILNPYYSYKEEMIQSNSLVMHGLLECVEKIFPFLMLKMLC